MSTLSDTTSNREGGRGAFILFEGVDRCGKTTQAELLVEGLQRAGHDACFMRFPGFRPHVDKIASVTVCPKEQLRNDVAGDLLDNLPNTTEIDDRCVHLLFSANRWEAESNIRAKLAQGTTVVCDRYAYSGVAFSASKPGLDLTWCKDPDRGLPAPDVILYLDISVEDAMKRGQFGQERYEKEEFQRNVRQTFLALMEQDKKDEVGWQLISANRPVAIIRDEIMQIAVSILENVKETKIPLLWPVRTQE